MNRLTARATLDHYSCQTSLKSATNDEPSGVLLGRSVFSIMRPLSEVVALSQIIKSSRRNSTTAVLFP